jgi:hypothetical protein
MQPQAHRGRERDFGLEGTALVAEVLLEFEPHLHGPLGMVLVPRRPAENGKKSIHTKVPEAPLNLLDHVLGAGKTKRPETVDHLTPQGLVLDLDWLQTAARHGDKQVVPPEYVLGTARGGRRFTHRDIVHRRAVDFLIAKDGGGGGGDALVPCGTRIPLFDLCHKAITGVVEGSNLLLSAAAVANRPARRHNAIRDNALAHGLIWPQILDQFVTWHRVIAVFYEVSQDLKGSRIDPAEFAATVEFMGLGIEVIAAKGINHGVFSLDTCGF